MSSTKNRPSESVGTDKPAGLITAGGKAKGTRRPRTSLKRPALVRVFNAADLTPEQRKAHYPALDRAV